MINTNYDFNVSTQPVFCNDKQISGRRAVVREDTNEVFNIVSDQYKVIHHREVIDLFDNIDCLERNNTKFCYNGAVMFTEYNFKDIEKSIAVDVGDIVDFNVRVFNSYNLMTGIGYEIRGNRLICSNGMAIPKRISAQTFKHFQSIDLTRLKNDIMIKFNKSINIVETWKEWMNIKPTTEQFDHFFKTLELGEKEKIKLLAGCLNSTLWEAYNVLTAHITHDLKSRKSENLILSQRNKEQEIVEKFYKYSWN